MFFKLEAVETHSDQNMVILHKRTKAIQIY